MSKSRDRIVSVNRSASSFSGKRHLPQVKIPEDVNINVYPVKVYDQEGKDVTPVPLFMAERMRTAKKGAKDSSSLSNELSSGGEPQTAAEMSTSAKPFSSTFQATGITGGPFARSVFQGSTSQKESMQLDEEFQSFDRESESSALQPYTEVFKAADSLQMVEPSETFVVNLQETDTFFLLDFSGVSVEDDSPDAEKVLHQNEAYETLCKARVGNDLYVEKGANTYNEPQKLKAAQTTPIVLVDSYAFVSDWDKFESLQAMERAEAAAANKEPEEAEDVELEGNEAVAGVEKSAGRSESRIVSLLDSQLSASSHTRPPPDGAHSPPPTDYNAVDNPILHTDDFRYSLMVIERAVNLNTYHQKLATYRGTFPIVYNEADLEIDSDAQVLERQDKRAAYNDMDSGLKLNRLWAFACAATKDFTVTCIKANRRNSDLFAVGYGTMEFALNTWGLVCCWSLKNAQYPERLYRLDAGVTAVDWCMSRPNLLAVGLYNGEIAIFDVTLPTTQPVLRNFSTHSKHIGPIWELSWIEKDQGAGEQKTEVLVSSGADGRVVQWQIRKGFEHIDLMKIKRSGKLNKSKAHERKSEAFIAKFAGGTCLDFSPLDKNVYLVGNEEGFIQKCSVAYNENYLESYNGHQLTCPIYQVKWSPFVPEIFISCGADWSIRVWNQNRLTPIINLNSVSKAVHDVCWSPHSSTTFAVANYSTLEIWDLALSTLDPVIVNEPLIDTILTKVLFAANASVLLVGDASGQVSVYELKGLRPKGTDHAQILQDVLAKSLATQLEAA